MDPATGTYQHAFVRELMQPQPTEDNGNIDDSDDAKADSNDNDDHDDGSNDNDDNSDDNDNVDGAAVDGVDMAEWSRNVLLPQLPQCEEQLSGLFECTLGCGEVYCSPQCRAEDCKINGHHLLCTGTTLRS